MNKQHKPPGIALNTYCYPKTWNILQWFTSTLMLTVSAICHFVTVRIIHSEYAPRSGSLARWVPCFQPLPSLTLRGARTLSYSQTKHWHAQREFSQTSYSISSGGRKMSTPIKTSCWPLCTRWTSSVAWDRTRSRSVPSHLSRMLRKMSTWERISLRSLVCHP